jgi:hypothetical protein
MATLEAIDDINLVKGTLNNLDPPGFQQVAQSQTDYEVFPLWFKKEKMMIGEGIGVQRNIMARLPDAARHVGWTDQDNPNVADLLENITVPWRQVTTNWSFKRQEVLMNRGKALITKIIEPKRAGAIIDMIEAIEVAGFSMPASASDKTLPYGLTYWIVKNATTGYTGASPFADGTIAGLTLADAPNFKNYSTTYVSVSQDDLLKKMRTAFRRVKFKSPVDINDYRKGRGMRYRIYMNEPTIANVEQVALAQNDNLGVKDVSQVDHVSLAFKGVPMRFAEYLDNDTANPVYLVDHSTFYPIVLDGDYMHEHPPIQSPTQHNWRTVYLDMSYNHICIDRRRNAVLYVAA